MRRLSAVLLLVVAFAIPWENLVIFEQLGSLVRVLGLVAASIGVCAVLLDGRLRKFSPALVLAALWVLWGGLSLFWSIEADSTVDRVLTYVQLLGLMWLMWEFGADARSRSTLTQAYVFGAYVSLVGTLVGFASGAQLDAKRYTTGTFNVNDLGLTFALGIPMAWYLVLTQQNRILRWINQAYVPAAVVGVLLTASRGAFVATVIATSMVVGSMSKLPLRTKLLALLLITSALIAAAFVVPQSSWQRLAQGQQSLQRWDLTGRTAIWEEGLRQFRVHPVRGMGAGAFPVTTKEETGRAWVAHNTYLGILIDEGIVGLGIFALLGVVLVLSLRRVPPLERRLCFVLTCTWAVGVFVLSWEHRKPTWFLLGLVTAYAGVAHRDRAAGRASLASQRRRLCVP